MELVFLKNVLKHPGCWNIFQKRDFEEDSLLLFFLATLQKTARSSVSVLSYFQEEELSAVIDKENKCQEIQDIKAFRVTNIKVELIFTDFKKRYNFSMPAK